MISLDIESFRLQKQVLKFQLSRLQPTLQLNTIFQQIPLQEQKFPTIEVIIKQHNNKKKT